MVGVWVKWIDEVGFQNRNMNNWRNEFLHSDQFLDDIMYYEFK